MFATTPAVRVWRGVAASRHWAGPLRVSRFVVILLGVVCAGAAVGSLPVVVTGYAEAAGNRTLSGWLLAAQAVGALTGGLAYMRARPGGPARLPLVTAALAVGFVPLLAVPGPALMAVLLAVAGFSLPPVLTAVFLTADRLTPAGTAVEAFAWIITAFTVGSAGRGGRHRAAGGRFDPVRLRVCPGRRPARGRGDVGGFVRPPQGPRLTSTPRGRWITGFVTI